MRKNDSLWNTLTLPEDLPGWKYLGAGKNRIVFRRPEKNWVLKIPINPNGEIDNGYESDLYQRYQKHSTRFAKCYYLELHGIGCQIMEYVYPLTDGNPLPPWTKYLDCQQVGRNSQGNIVAYDYGINSGVFWLDYI